jgi:hypothetical protein
VDVVAAIAVQAREEIEHVIVNLPDVEDPSRIATFAHEIVPAAAELAAAR